MHVDSLSLSLSVKIQIFNGQRVRKCLLRTMRETLCRQGGGFVRNVRTTSTCDPVFGLPCTKPRFTIFCPAPTMIFFCPLMPSVNDSS